MKKQVLIGSVLLAAISTFSQTGSKQKPTGLINTKTLIEAKFGVENAAPTKISPVKPTAFPVRHAAKSSAVANTWQNISASMNIYGMTISYCKPLQWNDELNAVSFIHRKSPTYVISPTPSTNAETGGIVAMVSTNCGVTWDSTALFANDNFWARYPSGAIYNPAGNTDINNTYIVGAGPTTGAGSVTWIGNWYASKKLGTYNNVPSTAPNAQQVIPTAGPFTPEIPTRHDFAAYGFTSTDDGKMRVLAGISDDALNPVSDTSIMLLTGSFNQSTSTFDWKGRVFPVPATFASDGSQNFTSRPMMAWNEQGTIGYVAVMGAREGATGSNAGMQPIVWKSTDSGVNWTLETAGINFNSSEFNDVKKGIWPTSVGGDTVPNFYWGEGVDMAVDKNNKLHIFSSILGHASSHPDSLNFVNQWTNEKYLWPHEPTARPYLWDFVYNGTAATPSWSHMLIDSMSSEGPGQRTTDAGYQDNPWDADPATQNQKVRLDARLQMSRTPDGSHLLYTWSESDTNYTDNQKKWNNLPNIKARLFDVTNGQLSDTEIDLTTDAPGEVANRAMFYFISPKFKLVSATATEIKIDVPTTVSNSNPYAQLTGNTHWYSCAEMNFQRADFTGIADNNKASSVNSVLYPNPAKNSTSVNVSLTTNSKVQVEVLNTIGQVVKTTQAQGQTGANTINVDLNGLSSGIYLVKVKVDNASSTKKLVIE